MKVLIIFSSPHLGGAEKSLTKMSTYLPSEIQLTLATAGNKGTWSHYCEEMELQHHVLGDVCSIKEKKISRIAVMLNIYKILRKGKFDLVYGIGLRLSIVLRFMLMFFQDTKFIHGVRWNPDTEGKLDIVFRVTERLFSRLVSSYICNSNAARNILVKKCLVPEEKVKLIYNGIETLSVERFSNSKKCQLILVANNSPRKGILQFIEQVIVPMKKEKIDFKLTITGSDDKENSLKRYIESNKLKSHVQYDGFSNQVDNYLLNSNIFVLPSLWNEGCPTSILEAMRAALPVVAFEIDGIPELIKNGQDGLLVTKGDYKDFKSKLVNLCVDRKMQKMLGLNGKEKCESNFSLAKCSNLHLESFKAQV